MQRSYDVIVAGAGISGFAAAIGARQAGASVLLLDKRPSAGGTAVYALTPVLSGWPYPQHGGGVADMLKNHLEQKNQLIWRNGNADTEETFLQLAMLELLTQAGVEMLFDAEVVKANVTAARINSITVNHANTTLELAADYFVDATGDAILSALAGAETTIPPVELSMTKTLMFKIKNVLSFDKTSIKSRFKTKQFPFAIQTEFMGTRLLRDDEIIVNLSAVTGNAADPDDHARMYKELTAQIPVIVEWLKKEFPEFARIEISKIAPAMGVRYSRSIVGRRQLDMSDIQNPQPPPEPVGLCGHYIGGHYVDSYDAPWGHDIPGKPAIPYGALRSKNIDNLAACGRIIDVDPRVVSAVRLCVSCMASGQAAGIAAALDMPEYAVLKQELIKQNCLFEFPQNINQ